jgi:hypothetical protein
MAEQIHQHGAGPYDLDSIDGNAADRGIDSCEWRPSPQRGIVASDDYAPRFSDDQDEPEPSEFIVPLQKRRVSTSSRVLAAVCVAATVAVLFSLFSSDDMRDLINVKASMASIVPVPATTAQADPAPLMPPAGAAERTARAPNVAVAGLAPTQDDMKNADQGALQPRAPAPAAIEQPAPPVETLHRLDPAEIAASLKRAEALIASGDIAAGRLVLRRPANDGDAQAAIAMAGTYDPAVLEKLGVHGVVADIAIARAWYEKARRFGATDATHRLDVLASKPR